MKYILIAMLLFSINLSAKNNQKFWDNKQVQIDAPTKNNKPDGTTKFFHRNGQLYMQIDYKDGQVTSKEVKLFDKDGKLICTNHYKNAKPDGVFKTFLFQNKMEPLYDGSYKDGKFTGVENTYYKDGKLRTTTPYKDGKKDGIEKKYDYKGELIFETPYKDGKKNGLEKSYTTNGKSEVNYKAGVKNGEAKLYYKNGKVESLTNYKNGKKDGQSIEYSDDGKIAWKGSFKNGKLIQ